MVVSASRLRLPCSELPFHVAGDFVERCERISGEADGSDGGDR